MLKRLSLLGAVAVAIVVGVQTFVGSRRPPVEQPPRPGPPREQAPAVDPVPAPRVPSPSAELVPLEAVANNAAELVDVWSPSSSAPATRKFERRFMFDCDGDRFFMRIGDGEAFLLPPGSLTGHYIALARTGSAWRGRYANESIVFRHDGDLGAFQLGQHTFENCVATRDRAGIAEANGGVLIQAFGHDPTWTFEITPQDLTLTTEGGARQVQVPTRSPLDNGSKMTFRSVLGTQEMVAVIDRVRCFDAPTGETLPAAVSVTFDRKWYYGCGRFIAYR